MKLATVLGRYPGLFYEQTWYEGHAFLEADHTSLLTMPTGTTPSPDHAGFLPYASTLAMLYVSNPDADIWRHWLWTADRDDYGNRVYVAGVGQGGVGTWQIHRALDYDRLCAVPVWEL